MFPTKSVAACHVRRTFASLTSLGVGVWLLVCPASARAQVLVTGRDITATEGIARINVLVATFTDLPTDNITNYTAAIDWGDSTMSTGVISAAAGHFNVRGTHTYVEEGFFIPTITVNDSDGSTNFDVGTATVDDAPLAGIGRTITPVEGVSFTAIIADFSDANPFATTNDFTASIDWGDGAVTAGRVAPDGTDFSVTGTHTYAAEGMYDITVSVDDVGGSGVVISSVANASDVPLSVTGVVLTPVEGVPFTNVVATFTDPDPTIDSPASFSATINWSDGTVSAGIVSTNGTGGFTVTGDHTYAIAGSYQVLVSLTEPSEFQVANVSSTALVSEPCAPDVTAKFSIVRGKTKTTKTGAIIQPLVLRNISTDIIDGPVTVVLDDLTAGITLVNADGETETPCTAPVEHPFRNVPGLKDNSLDPGQSAKLNLKFRGGSTVNFTIRILAGTGLR